MTKTNRKLSRFKANFEKPFQRYIQKNFAEHYRRISGARRLARNALFTYPLSGLFFVGAPLGAICLAATWLFKYNPPWFSQVAQPESAGVVLPLMYISTGLVAAFAMFVGMFLGMSRANRLILDSERNEIQVRQVYYMAKILRNSRRNSTSHYGSMNNAPAKTNRMGADAQSPLPNVAAATSRAMNKVSRAMSFSGNDDFDEYEPRL